MQPFRNILVYAPETDAAFVAVDQAATLARAHGASITVMRVLEPGGPLLRWARRSRGDDDMRQELERIERERIAVRVARLRQEGLPVEIQIRWGVPWMELIHAVLREGHDLLVKTSEGAARGRGLYFGSTALHLVRKCPCPVWIVQAAGGEEPKRVLAAVDPEQADDRPAVGRRVLRLAASMAGPSGELRVASVWRAPGETLLRGRMSPSDLADYVRSSRESARLGLDEAMAILGEPIPSECVHLSKGEPGDVLPALADRLKPDLLVMASLGRTGVAGLLIGDTAESLVRTVRCSVLVVKPPGFTSPLRLPEDEGQRASR